MKPEEPRGGHNTTRKTLTSSAGFFILVARAGALLLRRYNYFLAVALVWPSNTDNYLQHVELASATVT